MSPNAIALCAAGSLLLLFFALVWRDVRRGADYRDERGNSPS